MKRIAKWFLIAYAIELAIGCVGSILLNRFLKEVEDAQGI